MAGAADCDEVLRLSDRQSFDLVITDSPTLERDRSETLAALRRRSPDLKVMAVASHTLVKPFDNQQLLDAIKRVLQS